MDVKNQLRGCFIGLLNEIENLKKVNDGREMTLAERK